MTLRAVVIDTSPVICRVFSLILQDYGFSVQFAQTARDGIAAIARSAPGVVIADASLPGDTALDVLRYVRDQLPKSVHAVYCTSHFNLEELLQAREAGATDFIVKPVDRSVIASKVPAWTANTDNRRETGLLRAAGAEHIRV